MMGRNQKTEPRYLSGHPDMQGIHKGYYFTNTSSLRFVTSSSITYPHTLRDHKNSIRLVSFGKSTL